MTFRNLRATASFAAMALLALSTLPAFALPAHNVPTGLALATDQGRVNANTELNLTVVLTLHNRVEFDKAVEKLYDLPAVVHRQRFREICAHC
jgi:hypothetical protein